MDVSPMLVADLQAPEAVEPGERPFDHPAVASQAVLGLDTTASYLARKLLKISYRQALAKTSYLWYPLFHR